MVGGNSQTAQLSFLPLLCLSVYAKNVVYVREVRTATPCLTVLEVVAGEQLPSLPTL
jgi:hypothetical protein